MRVKVWREVGFDDGHAIAWRAQVENGAGEPLSTIGVGPSRDAAVIDCLRLHDAYTARLRAAAATVEYLTLKQARSL